VPATLATKNALCGLYATAAVHAAERCDQACDIKCGGFDRGLKAQLAQRLRGDRADARDLQAFELAQILIPEQRREIPHGAAAGERETVHLVVS